VLVARDDTSARKIPFCESPSHQPTKKFSLDVNEFTAESRALA